MTAPHAVRRTLDELVKEGTVEKIGLSNYSAAEVTRIHEICKAGRNPP